MGRQHHNCLALLLATAVTAMYGPGIAEPDELQFEFDAKKYSTHRGKTSPRRPKHCTVLMQVRSESKRRPLYAYGRNLAGVMAVTLDNAEGLGERFKISTKGQAEVLIDRYSVTRALDASRIAATDWVKADPHPSITLAIDKITDWKPRGKDLSDLMLTQGAWTKEKMRSVRPAFDVKVSGEIRNGKKTAPFAAPAAIVLGQGAGYFFMTLDVKVSMKGELLGLSGADRKDKLTLSFTTTAYSEPPKSLASPKAADAPVAPTLDLDLDL